MNTKLLLMRVAFGLAERNSELGGASDFVREYTPASGGPYCDCGYKKKALVEKLNFLSWR